MSSTKLSASARRVQEFLAGCGFDMTVKELPGSTKTAQDAAVSIGCEVAQIAKALVFAEQGTSRPVLVIASGANRVSLDKVRYATGLRLGAADGKYVKQRVGFAIGGVPPVGHSERLETLLDRDLRGCREIWAAAGTPYAVFRLVPDELSNLTGGRWIDISD